jgi:hypothetical protein
VVRATELIGLGVTPASVHEGLVAEPRSAEIMAREDYRRIGVGAVEGPLGLVTVVLFAA